MVTDDYKSKLLFLAASHTIVHSYSNLPTVLLPILINDFGISLFIASIIIVIPRVSSLIFSVPSGLLSDRLGHTKLISFSLFVELLAGSLVWLYPSVETIILSFALTSVGTTFYHPSALSAISVVLPSEYRSTGMGLYSASGVLGMSIGPLTLGLILNWFEWRYVYLVWILPILIIAIASFLITINEHSSEYEVLRQPKGLITPLKEVLTASFLSLLLLMLIRSVAGTTISTYIATYLTESKGLKVSAASIIFGLSPLIGVVSPIIGGYLGDKVGWKKSFTFLFIGVVATLLGVFLSVSTVHIILFYLCFGFLGRMTMPIRNSLVSTIVPQNSRGTAYSFQFIPMSVIGVVMPIILSLVISVYDLWIIFPIAIVFYILALIYTQILQF
jgi:MFS family permease